jgi:hypothetical protein
VIAAEPAIWLSCFAGVLFVMAPSELLAPRRSQSIKRLRHWPNNLGVVVRYRFDLAAPGTNELDFTC